MDKADKNQFCLSDHAAAFSHLLCNVKLSRVKEKQSLDEIRKSQSTIYPTTSHEVHCMNFSLVNFHRVSVTIFREITSHYGDHHSIKKYLAGVKTDLWGFIRFLEMTSRYDKHNFLLKANI